MTTNDEAELFIVTVDGKPVDEPTRKPGAILTLVQELAKHRQPLERVASREYEPGPTKPPPHWLLDVGVDSADLHEAARTAIQRLRDEESSRTGRKLSKVAEQPKYDFERPVRDHSGRTWLVYRSWDRHNFPTAADACVEADRTGRLGYESC